MIFKAPPLEPDELAIIDAIDAIKALLADQIIVPTSWSGLTYREIYVQTLQEGVARKERAPRLSGYRRAMNYILQRFDDPNFKYDLGLISALHFMINEEDQLSWPGKWRIRDAGVLDADGAVLYRAPEAAAIPQLMRELVDFLNDKDDSPAIVRATVACLTLVRIHPFRDGNGRLSRCLYALIMARARYLAPELMSIEEYIGHHREEFDRIFNESLGREWNPNKSTRPLLRFCLSGHYRQAVKLLQRYYNFARLCVELNADMTETGVESGVSIAATDLFAMPRADQLTSWPRIVSEEIEAAARTRVPFRFYTEESLPKLSSRASSDTAVAALLDSSLIEGEVDYLDPFEIQRQWRGAERLDGTNS